MKDVFISYKAEEFDEANWVKSVLETNGVSCWMAPMCIAGGSSYAVEIPKAIKEAKVFVLILSEKSHASKWVSREVDLAINEGKIVLPFMFENCSLKDDFNFYLTNVQRYAAYENKMVAVEKMIKEIKALLGEDTQEVKMAEPEVKPIEVQKGITGLVLGIISSLLAFSVLFSIFGFIIAVAMGVVSSVLFVKMQKV